MQNIVYNVVTKKIKLKTNVLTWQNDCHMNLGKIFKKLSSKGEI